MDKLVISYATAILELQNEENISSKKTLDELKLINNSFDADVKKFLYSKAVDSNEKKKVLSYALKGINENVVNFIYVLIDNYRINLLNDIIIAYEDLLDKKEGVIRINVKLAKHLDDEQRNDLKEAIKNKLFKNEFYNDIEINEVIDTSILKGLVIEYQGKVIDASLVSKQESLKEFLEK